MAARATRSASGAASSSSDDASRCLLLALSHDELGVIVDGLADPLKPVVAVALSSTCLGLRTPLRAALEVLQQRHEKAAALGRKADKRLHDLLRIRTRLVPLTCADLRDAEELNWHNRRLTADDMATLATILPWMPTLRQLDLSGNSFGDQGLQFLVEGLGRGAVPSLKTLELSSVDFGPVGAEAFAAALRMGALPNLEILFLGNSKMGKGVAALAPGLKKLPALRLLDLGVSEIDDEGVSSLLDNLGKDEFKALEELHLDGNLLTDKGCATVVAALKAGALPAIKEFYHPDEASMITVHASEEACAAVDAALQKRLDAKRAYKER